MQPRQLIYTLSAATGLLAGYYANKALSNINTPDTTRLYHYYDPVRIRWEDGSITEENGNQFSTYLLDEHLRPELYDDAENAYYSHFMFKGKFAEVIGAVLHHVPMPTPNAEPTAIFLLGLSTAGFGLYYAIEKFYPNTETVLEQPNQSARPSYFSSAANFFQSKVASVTHAANVVGEYVSNFTP